MRNPRSPARSRTLRRGFTLIELVVAMLLITVALVSTAGLVASSLRFQRGAASREDMVTLAEFKLDELRAYQLALPFTTQWQKLAAGGSVTSSVDGYADSLTSLSGAFYRRRWQLTNSTAGTRRLVLRVEPTTLDGSAPSKLEFQTLIFVQ